MINLNACRCADDLLVHENCAPLPIGPSYFSSGIPIVTIPSREPLESTKGFIVLVIDQRHLVLGQGYLFHDLWRKETNVLQPLEELRLPFLSGI